MKLPQLTLLRDVFSPTHLRQSPAVEPDSSKDFLVRFQHTLPRQVISGSTASVEENNDQEEELLEFLELE